MPLKADVIKLPSVFLKSLFILRYAYKILVGKCDRKRQYKRCRHNYENNIRIDLRETGWEGVD
jgi:hypothetical protein